MQVVIVIVAGVVTVIVVYVVIRLIDWFRSIRQIATQPPEIHTVVGSQASTLLFIYRKRARSFTFLPVPGTRSVTLRITIGNCFQFATLSPVTANNGLAVVTINGVQSGNGTFAAEVASSQPNRSYGPVFVPVHVYTPGRVPKGVVLTPKIDLVVTRPDGGEEEDE